ncbi:MAG TPA: ribosome maturation factor RimM [Candidatus Eubacterium faecigallinarum]|nr:ribosome maturation factor RimM [Candidatus Eubacterium faecigallinarum]
MKQFLEVGLMNNTHGIRGELKLILWCDDIEYLKQFKTLYLDDKGKESVDVLAVRPQKNAAIIKLSGIDTIEKAQALKGRVLYCNRDDAEISEDANYIADLIGCSVIDIDSGENYGEVTDVLNYGSCDIYEINAAGKRLMIPATADIVKQINTDKEEILIKKMKGLFDED